MNDLFTKPQSHQGWVEVIVGCMFSGKTEELIKQIRRALIGRQKTQTFKPRLDTRYSLEHVASHDQTKLAAFPVHGAYEIVNLVEASTTVVAIDEGQFLGEELIEVVNQLAAAGKRVIIAGLDTDWRGRPFGPMPHLMAIAEVVRKQHAICAQCGGPASRTQRLVSAQDDILVGSTEAYEARCRLHFEPDVAAPALTATPDHLTLSHL